VARRGVTRFGWRGAGGASGVGCGGVDRVGWSGVGWGGVGCSGFEGVRWGGVA